MIVLDTNVFFESMKPAANPAVRAWLKVAETLYLNNITLAEIRFWIGILPAGRRRNSLTRTLDGLLALFGDRVLPFDADAGATTQASRSPRVTPAEDFERRTDISLR